MQRTFLSAGAPLHAVKLSDVTQHGLLRNAMIQMRGLLCRQPCRSLSLVTLRLFLQLVPEQMITQAAVNAFSSPPWMHRCQRTLWNVRIVYFFLGVRTPAKVLRTSPHTFQTSRTSPHLPRYLFGMLPRRLATLI